MALPPWDDQIFDFGWIPYGPTISQCSLLPITMSDRRKAGVQSTRPYAVNILAGGYVPQSANITIQPDGSFQWIVDIPLGIGPHILYMTDAKGYTGGTSLAFEMTTNSTCTPAPWTPNQLAFNVTGEPKQCGTMAVTMNNGTAPYTLQAIASEWQPKTTHWSSQQMTYVVDLGISQKFFLVITDAEGKTAVSGVHTVGAGLTKDCLDAAPTLTLGIQNMSTYSTSVNTSAGASNTSPAPSSLPKTAPLSTAAIIGTVVGSVVFVALLLGIGIFLCLRRRPKKKTRGPPIDLGADDKFQELRSPPRILTPFEYHTTFPPREGVSGYSHGPTPRVRVTSTPSLQALLSPCDSSTAPNNTYSMYSHGRTSSAPQWGELPSAMYSPLVAVPITPLSPSVPPTREKRQLVMANTSDRDSHSPIAGNRLRSGAPSPPPYSPT